MPKPARKLPSKHEPRKVVKSAPSPTVRKASPPKPKVKTEPKVKIEPKKPKAPQRYVYLVWHTFDRVGYYHGDGEHGAEVCGVYENEADAEAYAEECGGEEDEDEEYMGRCGGEERSSYTVARAPLNVASSVCEYSCDF